MTDIAIRLATAADLDDVYDLFYRDQVGDDPAPPPRGDVPSFLRHLLATGEVRLAIQDGRVVGFAALITRGDVSYLAELFVRADEQSAGVGKRLLDAVLPEHRRPACTVSSSDPRALALYVRAGLTPCWPLVWLRAPTPQIGPLAAGGVTVVDADPGDPALVRWDAEIGGRRRPQDHRFWIAEGAIPVWFERLAARIGYGYLQTRSGSALWSRDAITVGPLGTRLAADAADCVGAAVASARTRRAVVRLAIPGSHPALPALLAAGLRITDLGTAVAAPASAPALPDPTRYLPSDDFF